MNTLITCEKPFFTWDEDNGYMRFATEAEALAYANETLSYCRKDAQHDGEWPDATEDIRVGIATHIPVASEPNDMGGVDFTLQPLRPADPKDQTEWDRVYALLRHWSQRAHAVETPLEAFRAAQVEAGIPEEDLMPTEPAAAVAWLIKAMPEWR